MTVRGRSDWSLLMLAQGIESSAIKMRVQERCVRLVDAGEGALKALQPPEILAPFVDIAIKTRCLRAASSRFPRVCRPAGVTVAEGGVGDCCRHGVAAEGDGLRMHGGYCATEVA